MRRSRSCAERQELKVRGCEQFAVGCAPGSLCADSLRPVPQVPASSHELADALEALRAQGGRVTGARRAVIEVLLRSDGDLSAGEIATIVEVTQPETHLSTVYRTLEMLEGVGIVRHVHAGEGRLVYQVAGQTQHHALCDTCGKVIDLPDDILHDVASQLRDDYDFELDTAHFPLLGRCAQCRRNAGDTPHRHRPR
jgi:Fur family ferric uptake transcriptional regulator